VGLLLVDAKLAKVPLTVLSFQEPSLSGTAGFPWTGVGYTYDWYYQDRNQWADGEGVGVAEFVLVPSTPLNVWSIEIVDVQTTAEYLGAAMPWPGVQDVQ